MARILQRSLFSWQAVDAHSDANRLTLVLSFLPDEALMTLLESRRGRGRNDYPIRAIWNSILAGIVFQHESIESLRRELMRNGELRQICGFDVFTGADAVPSSEAYSRFLRVLFGFESEIRRMFDQLVDELKKALPGFGTHLGYDGKAIDSAGKPSRKGSGDGRRDTDADWGKHTYQGVNKDGTLWKKVISWFGYKLHLLADTTYELPVGYRVTRASESEHNHLLEMVENTRQKHPDLIEDTDTLSADKGLDSTAHNVNLYDEYGIKPVIDIRNNWNKNGDEVAGSSTRQVFPERCDNIMFDYQGNVFCHCPATHTEQPMAYGGFEKDRQTLKYVCPVKQYGVSCKGASQCPHHNKHVRIPLKRDRRVFTPLARSSYRWKRVYSKRSAVERLNSRLDVSFGWERHYLRGLQKMRLRMGLSLIVMLAMALGHIKQGKWERMRSMVSCPEPILSG